MSRHTGAKSNDRARRRLGAPGRQALDAEYEDAYPSLFLPAMQLAYRMLGDRAAAEDVAAEALARAYARWESVRKMQNSTAWVLRVASNLTIDVLRRRRFVPAAADSRGFDDIVTLRLALAAALRRLPRRQRESLVLHFFAGLTDVEVSESLGITPSSVRTHLQRGLATLRSELQLDPEEISFVGG